MKFDSRRKRKTWISIFGSLDSTRKAVIWKFFLAIATASSLFHKLKAVGDVARLSVVLRNLLTNAIMFTPENRQIRVKTTREPVM